MKKRSLLSNLIRGVVFGVVALVVVDISRKDIHTHLAQAAHNGDIKRVKYFLAWGVDVNGGGFDGRTALFEACNGNQISMASFLLAHGADPNRALRYAIYTGNIEFTKMLIAAGAVIKPDLDEEARSQGNAAVYHAVHATFQRQQKPGVIAHKAPPK